MSSSFPIYKICKSVDSGLHTNVPTDNVITTQNNSRQPSNWKHKMMRKAGLEKAAKGSLPKQRKLTFDEDLQMDDSVYGKEISPIDVEVCGAGCQPYDDALLCWLVAAYGADIETKPKVPLVLGLALCLHVNGQLESIILSAHRRMLIVRVRHEVSRFRSEDYLIDVKNDLARLFYGRVLVEKQKIHPVGFHGALQVSEPLTPL